MKELFVVLLVLSLLVLPAFFERSLLWRVGLSKVSTYHEGNTQEWVKGAGCGGLETYTPPEPEIIVPE